MKAALSGIALVVTLGSIVIINYALGTNRAEKSAAAASADLAITKTVDLATACAGDQIQYDLSVSHVSGAATKKVTALDILPAGVNYLSHVASDSTTYDPGSGVWNIGKVSRKGAKSNHTLSIMATVTDSTPGDVIGNTGSIASSKKADPNAANDSAVVSTIIDTAENCNREAKKDNKSEKKKTEDKKEENVPEEEAPQETQVASADLTLSMDVSNTGPCSADSEQLIYSVTNLGGSDADDVIISAPLPTGVTYSSHTTSGTDYAVSSGVWNVGALSASGPNSTKTLTISVLVDATAGTSVDGSAAITNSNQEDPNSDNNSVSAGFTVAEQCQQGGGQSDENNQINDPEEGNNGNNSNNQNNDNETGDETSQNPGDTSKKSSGSTDSTDDSQNEPEPEKGQGADLIVIKKVDKEQVSPGDTVVFTTLLINDGPSNADDVLVDVGVPAGTDYRAYASTKGTYSSTEGSWNVGTLATQEQAQLSLTVNVDDFSNIGEVVTNDAFIAQADETDPDAANNSASADAVVADLAEAPQVVQKVMSLGNGKQQWTLTVFNSKNDDPIVTNVFNPIPVGATYISNSIECQNNGLSTMTQCSYDTQENSVVWSGQVAADRGVAEAKDTENSVIITFQTQLSANNMSVANTGCANWDDDKDGSIVSELTGAQEPVCAKPLIYSGASKKTRDIVTGLIYGVVLGFFIALLAFLLRKKKGKNSESKKPKKKNSKSKKPKKKKPIVK